MHALGKLWPPLLFGLALAAAAFIRFAAAPYSAGPDVAQFWSFAEAFRLYGLDFYRYAGARIDLFPFKFWAYVYPPIWLGVLGLAILIVPASTANQDMVSVSWRLAEKTPIILADLAAGYVLYWAVPGSRYRKLLYACLWLFNPAIWYNSAVFGQFDSIAAIFLLAALIFLERGNDRLAFILAALAGMTKQHTLIPFAVIAAIVARNLPRRRLWINLGLMAAVAAVISLPFLITGNFKDYFQTILFPGQAPDYQYPQMFAFNGISSVLSYLHTLKGWNTLPLIELEIPLLVLAIAAAAFLCYRRKIAVLRGALVGMLVFILFFYRINYQYLVVAILLALFVASRTQYKSERLVALSLAIFPAAWLWLVNVATWFVYLEPNGNAMVPVLEKLGLTHQGFPDWVYVTFTLVLTLLCAAYLYLTFTRWKEPLRSLDMQPMTAASGYAAAALAIEKPSK